MCCYNNRIQEYSLTQISVIELRKQMFRLSIDNHFSWDDYVNTLSNKQTSGIFALYRMSTVCDLTTLKTSYLAYIQSNIYFGIIVLFTIIPYYGATSKTKFDRILHIQKSVIRVILNLNWLCPVKAHFTELGHTSLKTVYSMYIYGLFIYIFYIYIYKEINYTCHLTSCFLEKPNCYRCKDF